MLNQRLLSGFQTEPTDKLLYFVDIDEKARVCTTTIILLIPFSDLKMAPGTIILMITEKLRQIIMYLMTIFAE